MRLRYRASVVRLVQKDRAPQRGQSEVIHECSPPAKDCTHRRCRCQERIDEPERARNRTKSRVRAKVEQVFGVLKLKFGFGKVSYRGIAKNADWRFSALARVNRFLVRDQLRPTAAA